MIRKYYVQVILFTIMVMNQVAGIWEGDQNPIIAWSGNEGYPAYYHYWLLFDYRLQLFGYLAITILTIRHPLERKYSDFAISSILLYFAITGIEFLRYMYHGSNFLNEQYYYYYLGGFTLGLVVLWIKFDRWR